MGIQNQTTSATTQASLMRCSSRLPLSDGSSMPVTAGTRLVLGKITSRVIRNCFQRRGWRTFTVGGVNQKAGSVRTSVRSPSVSSGAISATSCRRVSDCVQA
ncbi:Uncharacterised protein [Klebsiella pneumoniae]|uniref:Uncharacterized protein n=1 Tax=Klebsiella pneumoniae TaxID=573 RepID=A0A3S4GRM0_KLEPN|nr:Uncharacterised protein [Klebsiella pneumoniae]